MSKKIVASIIFLILIIVSVVYFFQRNKGKIISPLGDVLKIIEKPLDKYTFQRLKEATFKSGEITIGKIIKDEETFSSRIFYFKVGNLKASGLMNLPPKEGTYPIIVMLRGYVPKEIYTIGEGTRHAGEVLAENGFITLAPDFLGYGESDDPSDNSIEERFQTYTTSLTLLSSLKNLNQAIEATISANIKVDPGRVGLWGHSNGGQIALSILEITGKNYPTVLWAPVSKPFPYSVLYYTDEYDDHGRMLRRAVAHFEENYDIEKYSPTNYLEWINAPIQLHQAGADEYVPQKWSDQLYQKLKKLQKEVTYFTYPGDDHNFTKGSWPTVVQRSISFFKENFEK